MVSAPVAAVESGLAPAGSATVTAAKASDCSQVELLLVVDFAVFEILLSLHVLPPLHPGFSPLLGTCSAQAAAASYLPLKQVSLHETEPHNGVIILLTLLLDS
jgi:hypothetical protein